jgi:hypothetical protein
MRRVLYLGVIFMSAVSTGANAEDTVVTASASASDDFTVLTIQRPKPSAKLTNNSGARSSIPIAGWKTMSVTTPLLPIG